MARIIITVAGCFLALYLLIWGGCGLLALTAYHLAK